MERPMTWINTAGLRRRHPDIPEDVRGWLLGACSTRGKNKGMLLANAPNRFKHPERWAAWQYLVPSTQRMSAWSLVFVICVEDDTGRAYQRIQEACEGLRVDDLVLWTERPYRWNCPSSATDPDAVNASIARKYRNL